LLRNGLSIVAVALVAAPSVATFVERADANRSADPRPVLRQSDLVLSAPVGNRFYGHLWRAPSTLGGACSFVTVDHAPKGRRPPGWRAGGECGTAPRPPLMALPNRAHPLVIGMSIGRRPKRGIRARWVPPIVHGSVRRGLGARRVQVEWRTGEYRLAYRNGHFLGGTRKLYMPPFAAFPFFVVAYGASGREVARRKLDSPALRLMPGGWKQYAREYRNWKRLHR
jgi:hypothetical protein